VVTIFFLAGVFLSPVFFFRTLPYCKYSSNNELGGILSQFLSFHDFPFVGIQNIEPTIFRPWKKKWQDYWLRRLINIYFKAHRLELFVKGHFWVTIRKFVVTYVWRKCHLSHLLDTNFELVIFWLVNLVIFVSLFNLFIFKFIAKLSKLT